MSAATDPYNPRTHALFDSPRHAGDLSGDHARSAIATAAESATGACVQLAVGLTDGELQECRFRVYGCPHLVAAAEWLCNHLEDGPAAALGDFRAVDCMVQLAIPVEKTGRILLLEDAIRLLLEQLDSA
jgi:NifU-like protein involved in Fe-S cluster formation